MERGVVFMHWSLKIVEGPHSGEEYTFHAPARILVGRGEGVQCRLAKESRASRAHCQLELVSCPEQALLTDLGSTNGTWHQGDRLKPQMARMLRSGDLIAIGSSQLRLLACDDPPGKRKPPGEESTAAYRANLPHLRAFPPQPATAAASPGIGVPPQLQPQPKPPLRQENAEAPSTRHGIARINGQSHVNGKSGANAAVKGENVGADGIPPGFVTPPGYEFCRILGVGGMGMVAQVRETQTQRDYAAKVIIPEHTHSEKTLQMFLREVSVHSRLEHPRIVPFGHMGIHLGCIYFVMEYVKTIDVKAFLENLPVKKRIVASCMLARQSLDALIYAHNLGFVHRDVKPSNVLVSFEQKDRLRARVADFGLAKNFRVGVAAGITSPEEFRGTYTYAAPEVFENAAGVGPAADLYSLGGTLHWWLTGLAPRVSLEANPSRLGELRMEIPSVLKRIVTKAMSHNPRDRFRSALEFHDALAPFVQSGGR